MAFNQNNNQNPPNGYGLQATYRGAAITKQKADAFIPEVWSSEVKRAINQKLIASQFVKMHSFTGGKKGDTIHIPAIPRLGVNKKLPETPVVLQAPNTGLYTMVVDQYKESSFLIEDIVEAQAAYAVRSEYTREAGYALAKDLDAFVLGMRAAVNSFPAQVITNSTDGTLSGTSAPLNYTALLTAKLILDSADVPEDDRMLLVSPAQYNQLLAVERFINMDYRNKDSVTTGQVGTIFNVPVVMTSMLGANSNTGFVLGDKTSPTPGVGSTATNDYFPTQDAATSLPLAFTGSNSGRAAEVHTAIMCHKEWAFLAVPQQVKTESSRETLYLSDAFVASQMYGSKLYRPDHCVLIHTNGALSQI